MQCRCVVHSHFFCRCVIVSLLACYAMIQLVFVLGGVVGDLLSGQFCSGAIMSRVVRVTGAIDVWPCDRLRQGLTSKAIISAMGATTDLSRSLLRSNQLQRCSPETIYGHQHALVSISDSVRRWTQREPLDRKECISPRRSIQIFNSIKSISQKINQIRVKFA